MKKLVNYKLFYMLGLSPFCIGKIKAETNRPNVIIIFTDDQGVNDLGCYGSPNIKTPHIDKMSRQGMRFTNFYVSASVSSASRAGLLTGQLNTRNGAPGVFFPNNPGIPSAKITLGEMLQREGYKTACFGKWHLGDQKGHMPNDQGFDEYYGIPYSNDMYITPTLKISPKVKFREGWTMERALEDQRIVAECIGKNRNPIRERKLMDVCPLVEDSLIVEYPCDQSLLTKRYFEHAIDFIKRSKNNPFFCYITPDMPHIPLAASSDFLGSSERGLYGDVIQEIDANVGKLMTYLKKNHLDKNTLVLFASDNGPWLAKGKNGGSAHPFRDGKFSSYEGGVRLPFIAYWPGVIPAHSVNNNIFASIDIVPTIMNLIGYDEPMDLDGIDETATLLNPTIAIRHNYLYVNRGEVVGVRIGDWVYLPFSGKVRKKAKPELFNIKEDLAQEHNLYDAKPDIVLIMKQIYERYKKMYPNLN